MSNAMDDTRVRLLELMLYREAGGTGYDLAIEQLAEDWEDFYYRINQKLNGVKKEVEDEIHTPPTK